MKVKLKKRTITVKTIKINGEYFDVHDLIQFTQVASDNEQFIEKDDDYSTTHIYFNPYRENEVKIEKMLLEQGVIRRHSFWEDINNAVDNGEFENRKSENHIRYKLTPKYHEFYHNVWSAINDYEYNLNK